MYDRKHVLKTVLFLPKRIRPGMSFDKERFSSVITNLFVCDVGSVFS